MPPKNEKYTMRDALKESSELLMDQFGKVEQTAAVQLAAVLYGAHEREEFMKSSRQDERAFV